ncbi:hypothetical protein AAG570_013079 [Ranatra chinensis]|uniref:Uncharacterized protein n=1 Tax=Ranatra chinensis TaxID=642074 RepID=A0ABD0YFQ4_9HEMI
MYSAACRAVAETSQPHQETTEFRSPLSDLLISNHLFPKTTVRLTSDEVKMKSLRYTCVLFILMHAQHCCNGGILIPEELQTILQLVYSYMPPIRTGTDSKIGVGFRIGRNADFQIVLELGPQITTTESSSRRRRVSLRERPTPKTEEKHKDTVNKIVPKYDSNIAEVNDVKQTAAGPISNKLSAVTYSVNGTDLKDKQPVGA